MARRKKKRFEFNETLDGALAINNRSIEIKESWQRYGVN